MNLDIYPQGVYTTYREAIPSNSNTNPETNIVFHEVLHDFDRDGALSELMPLF